MEQTPETNHSSEPQEQKPRQLRGLYEHVHISVKALDTIILVCIAVIVIVLALDMRNPGFTITFDAKGGTDVPAHNQMYGQLLEMPEPPTREGYAFTGWYRDPGCYEPWVPEADTIREDMTLYAGWAAKSP